MEVGEGVSIKSCQVNLVLDHISPMKTLLYVELKLNFNNFL
jgi:hypothetical protein